MFNFIKSVMKTIFFKLYMNFIGAVYMFKENTYQRPRRLPDYGQLGETDKYWQITYHFANGAIT